MKSSRGTWAWAVLAWIIVSIGTATHGQGLTNTWTSNLSGKWHELSWALGVLPDISQSAISITNNGQKTIAITPITVAAYPGSIVISNLVLAGATNSMNTVVVDHTGTATPLQVFNSCTVASNGILLNLDGCIKLQGSGAVLIVNGGTVEQVGGSNIFAGVSYIGYGTNYGRYVLTNGSTEMGDLQIGDSIGGSFKQLGGSMLVLNELRMKGNGTAAATYELDRGVLSANQLTLASDAVFFQRGGMVNTVVFWEPLGDYNLDDGSLVSQRCHIGDGGSGTFTQLAGTHRTDVLELSSYYGDFAGFYTLKGGLLECREMHIGIGGIMTQEGGTNCANLLKFSEWVEEAQYKLSAGMLICSNVEVTGTRGDALFSQDGGTHITKEISIDGNDNLGGGTFGIGGYYLSEGGLACETCTIGPSGVFNQSGGAFSSSNLVLVAAGTPPYVGHGVLNHTAGLLTNSGKIRFSGGTLKADYVVERLGSIILETTSTNALGPNACVQFFTDSSQERWNSGATLVILNWHGLLSGGGLHQVFVGNSRYGLSNLQLEQVIFVDPFGLLPGKYKGKLLDSGELVPETRPSIDIVKTDSGIHLSWPSTYVAYDWSLQSATNVQGPYFDLFPAPNPYPVSAANKQQFFRLSNRVWTAKDIGIVAVAGNAFSANGVWTIAGDGADIWGTIDGFRYIYQPWTGDGSINARVLTCQPTDPWAKAGMMFRAGLDPGAANYAIVVNASSGSQSQWRSSTGAQTYSDWYRWSGIPYWVKVSRSGNTFLGCVSSDGTNWIMLTAQDIPMADPIYAGLAVSAHTTNALNTATLDNVGFSISSAPLPWASATVGAVSSPGSSVYSNDTFTIKSTGFDCWGTGDKFQCVYRSITGDATVTVHIANLQNGDPWAKAGVMLRNDLGSGSQYSATILTAGDGTILQRRYAANSGTIYINGPNLNAPCWLRVVRTGNVFYNYASADGLGWTLIGSADAVTMGSTACIVLFATTHNSTGSVSETAVFDSISIKQY